MGMEWPESPDSNNWNQNSEVQNPSILQSHISFHRLGSAPFLLVSLSVGLEQYIWS